MLEAELNHFLAQIKKVTQQFEKERTFSFDMIEEGLQGDCSEIVGELKDVFKKTMLKLLAQNEQVQSDQVYMKNYMQELSHANIELVDSKMELEAVNSQLQAYSQEIERMNVELSIKFEELKNLFHFSQEITSSLDPDMLYRKTLNDICKAIPVLYGGIFIQLDGQNSSLELVDTYYKDTEIQESVEYCIERFLESGRFSELFRHQEQFVVEDISREPFFLRDGVTALDSRCRTLSAIPVKNKQKEVRALMLFVGEHFHSGDQYLLNCYSNVLGIALENAKLYQDVNTMFFDTVKVLANTMEIKDLYTKGHVERVMDYSVAIARKMDFGPKSLEQIKIAAILHDIGKIGVPDHILNKPGKLSEEEFGIIKMHPRKGYEIIKDIPGLSQIGIYVKQHHERMDGKGYPEGLCNEQISLEAKIIAVADAFDAMTSDRSYRQKMSDQQAIEIITANQDTQFDPNVVKVFLEVLDSREDIYVNSLLKDA